MPVITPSLSGLLTKAQVYSALRRAITDLSFLELSSAFDEAERHEAAVRAAYRRTMSDELAKDDGALAVVLLGRPYTCLSSRMNKGIPELLASQGAKVFFQDMLTYERDEVADIEPLLAQVHWRYPTQVLEAARVVAGRDGLYPVLVSSFKCAPDSCTLEYARRILDDAGKPYLTLELDEHGSAIGYETRIEAAVRAFRNHAQTRPLAPATPAAVPAVPLSVRLTRYLSSLDLFRASAEPTAAQSDPVAAQPDPVAAQPEPTAAQPEPTAAQPEPTAAQPEPTSARAENGGELTCPGPGRPSALPRLAQAFDGRTLLIPNWDPVSCSLMAANLRRAGVDARVLHEDAGVIQRGLKHTTGQCIPLGTIAQSTIELVERGEVEAERATLWVLNAQLACAIGMFPSQLRSIFDAHGLEKLDVYVGDFSFAHVGWSTALDVWFANMFGGYLRRLACRVRPYEVNRGDTDAAEQAGLAIFERTFLGEIDKLVAARQVTDLFARIPTRRVERRPKVAIFGDMYVRDNAVMNQGLVRFIEEHGGEVVTTPYSEYLKLVGPAYLNRWLREGQVRSVLVNRSLFAIVKVLEKKYAAEFERVIGPIAPVKPPPDAESLLARYGVTTRHTGESFDNLLKVHHLLEAHPDIALFVQANPAFCCAAAVSEAMAGRIEEVTGVPIVNLTYDGSPSAKNDALVPYLAYPRRRSAAAREREA